MRVEEDHISDQGDGLGSKGKGRDPPGRCHNVSKISKVHKTTESRHRAVCRGGISSRETPVNGGRAGTASRSKVQPWPITEQRGRRFSLLSPMTWVGQPGGVHPQHGAALVGTGHQLGSGE